MKKLSVIFILVLVYSCDFRHREERIIDSAADPTANSPAELDSPRRELQTRSGKGLTVVESHPEGMSISDISIVPNGFEKRDSVSIKESDPIHPQVGVELADLDNNGFDEVYIYTQAVSSSSYGGVYAYASDKDKELRPIDCSKLEEASKALESQGYRGHDSFKIEGNLLVRIFPVYKETDANVSPSGGEKSIRYKLQGMKLVPVKI